jgi:predicted oxidoreductase
LDSRATEIDLTDKKYQTEVVIAGGGLAGMVTAFELLDAGKKVLLIDKDVKENFGGLAKESFGGILLVDTPQQKRLGIKDSPELALRDWLSFADFGETDKLPLEWAKFYCENSIEYIYKFLDARGIEFLPLVNWPERGAHTSGNTLPRWHIAWGIGHEIAVKVEAGLANHPRNSNLTLMFEHEVSGFEQQNGKIVGVHGRKMPDGSTFSVSAEHVVVASGGICGGDLSKVRDNWYVPWGRAPEMLLNGAHIFGDGLLHDQVQAMGGNLTHLDKQWHYAAGVHHPRNKRPNDGLSLVPPRSALWLNALGERIRNPAPIVAYTDTRHLVESILKEPGQYSWQLMNWKIAIKELAVSGCDYMSAFRYKRKLEIFRHLLFGNKELVNRLINECPQDIVVAQSLSELVDKMNEKNLGGLTTDLGTLTAEIKEYDEQIERGPAYFNDEQLRRIMNFRTYRGDRLLTFKYQKINDSSAMPFIAIREFILARKSLGGIQTDIDSKVLSKEGQLIPGLYAVGEAAGFGGGGLHGKGALEGAFLGACVLTGRRAAMSIKGA